MATFSPLVSADVIFSSVFGPKAILFAEDVTNFNADLPRAILE